MLGVKAPTKGPGLRVTCGSKGGVYDPAADLSSKVECMCLECIKAPRYSPAQWVSHCLGLGLDNDWGSIIRVEPGQVQGFRLGCTLAEYMVRPPPLWPRLANVQAPEPIKDPRRAAGGAPESGGSGDGWRWGPGAGRRWAGPGPTAGTWEGPHPPPHLPHVGGRDPGP